MDILIFSIVIFILIFLVLYMVFSMTPMGKKIFEASFKEIPLFHLQGIKNIPENTLVRARVVGGSVLFQTCDKTPTQIGIHINDISDAKFIAESEIIEKDRSVIARAIAGGLLFGAVGALVGGMSGIGTKKEEKITNLVKLYMKDGNEVLLTPFMNGEDIAKTFVRRLKGESSDQYPSEKPILITFAIISLFITISLLLFCVL